MCGICGKLSFEAGRPVSAELLHEMTGMLAHRGPDDEGFYRDEVVGLGHRRLSIVDVPGGHQPISNEDDTLWLVFNGEIYNHLELRRELEAKGHRYKTRTDTETILHAYEQYGTECVNRLRGMFAFVIWDTRSRTLFAARDRFGIKPFYYRLDGRSFSFASEVKALLIDSECDDDLDPIGIYDYFTSYVFGENTMFAAIKRLAPAHSMRIEDGKVETQRYWAPRIDTDVATRSPQENVEYLDSLLRTVITDHMMGEVPQGQFLSGGVDSSLITIYMNEILDEPVRTYTMAFGGRRGFDETAYAQQVADKCRTRHHVLECTPEHIDRLPDVLWHLEEPLADAPAIALFLLCREASREVKVVHCGDGGDEAFGGYTRFYWERYASLYNQLPPFLRRGVLNRGFRFAQRFPGALREFGRRAEKFTRYSELPQPQRYMTFFSNTPDIVKHQILQPEFLARVGEHRSVSTVERLFAEARTLGFDDLATRQYHDLYSFVSNSLMLKGDKMAMAAGIEGRFPWLDERLVNFGLSLPDKQKAAFTQLKLAPRRLLARHMPSEFVWRRKQGFGVPIEEWFKTSLAGHLRERISPDATAADGILEPAYLNAMTDALHAGDPHVWPHLWSVFVFQEWRKAFARPKQVCRDHLARAMAGRVTTT